jgi:lipoprotein-anchoring transpeptidase ErfK/SrfK
MSIHRTQVPISALLLCTALAACDGRDSSAPRTAAAADITPTPAVNVADSGAAGPYWADDTLPSEQLERGRLDMSWQRVVQIDTAGLAPVHDTESWTDITPSAVNTAPATLPLGGDVAGPSVLRVQVLLDRALFSPGMLDGRWGKNTAKAVYWLQKREGLRATGTVDSATFARLAELAGAPKQLVVTHRLSEDDVKGPFMKLPTDIYARAELDCSCYESLSEKLGERFHVTPELLAQLNPGVDLDALKAGAQLNVPNVRDSTAATPAGKVAEIVVSKEGSFVHAMDAQGRILYHFPSTLGSSYDPSPTGDYHVKSITRDPWWHYQPAILAHVDSSDPDATIPPGPNNAVGVVWMALSAPHYGIHGTSSPQTIGYATSAGCVRLTNWDASFLASQVEKGTPVRFRDTGK